MERLKELDIIYIPLPEESLPLIYQLFCHEVIGTPQTGLEYCYFGIYYHTVKKDLPLSIKFYRWAIQQDNVQAMADLGYYYESEEINYDLMKQYYGMAIARDHVDSMVRLGDYYRLMEKNYDLMKQCYHRAIEQNYDVAMNNLGYYYQTVEKNDEMTKYYYSMAAHHGCVQSMFHLACFYQKKSIYYLPLMKKYVNMAIQHGHDKAMGWMTEYYLKQSTDRREAFLFGAKHHITELLVKHYCPEYAHYLLEIPNKELTIALLKKKDEYQTDLFQDLRMSPTWLRYCVKDVFLIIQTYTVN